MFAWLPDANVNFHFGDMFACEPDWSWCSRFLSKMDLWYIVEGRGWIRERGEHDQNIAISGGDCVLMREGHAYEAGHIPDCPLRIIVVHFDLTDAEGNPLAWEPSETTPLVQHMEAGSLVRDMLTRAVRCFQDDCHPWTGPWLQPVLMEIIRQQTKAWMAGRFGEQARRIEEICEHIRNNPGETVRVENLATDMGISAEHFCRLFRRLQGVSPRAFITRTRIEAAQRLLLTSRHSIERIAGLLGYTSPFQFSRQFKSKTGRSPSTFRASGHASF